jgi:ribosomal protein S18 acetylase RimI-like enzyme
MGGTVVLECPGDLQMNSVTIESIKIMPIAEEHIEGFYQCLDSVARERRHLAFVQAPPLESVRKFVLSNMANNVPQLVALSRNILVGWCDISPMKYEGFTHCGTLGMGVHKDFRRLGIGTKLLEHTIGAAKEIGLERIELEVFASNTAAIRLYEKAGFVVEGVKKKGRKLAGEYDDLVQMALFI